MARFWTEPPGSPVPGAQVYLLESGKYVFSDEIGAFNFTDIPVGQYHIGAKRIGYAQSISYEIEIQQSNPTRILIPLVSNPIAFPDQEIISNKSRELNIISNGNTTIVNLPPGN